MSDQLAMFAPTARATDPDTSHMAARDATANAATNLDLALMAIHLAGDRGLTDFDLAAATGIQQTSIGVRRGELAKAGLVVKCLRLIGGTMHKYKRPSPSGSLSQVWVCTTSGHDAARRLMRGES